MSSQPTPTAFPQAICELSNMAELAREDSRLELAADFDAALACLRTAPSPLFLVQDAPKNEALIDEIKMMADLSDKEESVKDWIMNELMESRYHGKADALDLLIGRLQSNVDKLAPEVAAYRTALIAAALPPQYKQERPAPITWDINKLWAFLDEVVELHTSAESGQVYRHFSKAMIESLAANLTTSGTVLATATPVATVGSEPAASGWLDVKARTPEEDNDYKGPIFGLWLYSKEFGVEDGFYNSYTKMWVANVPAHVGVKRTTRHNITHYRLQETKPTPPTDEAR